MNCSAIRRRDERGAVLLVATAGVVVALIAASLAVDLGSIAEMARRNQKVADLAALDAVRVLPTDPTAAARASATRNAFALGSPDRSLLVDWAPSVAGPWTTNAALLAGATAVRVAVTSAHDRLFPFVSTGQTKTRRGVAQLQDKAQVSVGSKLASLSLASDGTVLDRITSRLLRTSDLGTDLGLDLVSYKGLAGANVSLGQIVAADSSLGTVDQLLTSSVNLRRLALATVTALNNRAAGGDAAAATAATVLGGFAASIAPGLNVSLGQILSFQQPSGDAAAAAAADLNVFNLVTASAQQAQLANGVHLLTVDNLTLGIAGLASSTLKMDLIEAPQLSALGPAQCTPPVIGTCVTAARTAQVRLELTTRITAGACPGILCLADVVLPLQLTAAPAVASLTAIRCADPVNASQVDVRADTAAVQESAAASVKVALLPAVSVPLGPVNLGSGAPQYLTFNGPFPTAVRSTTSSAVGLSSLLSTLPVLGPTLALLTPVTDNIETKILKPVIEGLGLSLGGADLSVTKVTCGSPILVQ